MTQNTQITQTDTKIQRINMSEKQLVNLGFLQQKFGLSDSEINRCLFFSKEQDEPWIPYDLRLAIARISGGFTLAKASHEKVVLETNQVVYNGIVIDQEGRTYERPGVASL